MQAEGHRSSAQHVSEGYVLNLEPHSAKDYTLPSHSRSITIAPEPNHSEKPPVPASEALGAPSNDSIVRPRCLAPVNFNKMQAHASVQMDTRIAEEVAEVCAHGPGPGDYSPPEWLQVLFLPICSS
jgi:hypothetical protein